MKTLKDIFVSYEIALKLKEIGFDEGCIGYFEKDNPYLRLNDGRYKIIRHNGLLIYISAPTYEQVVNWFNKQCLYGNIIPMFSENKDVAVEYAFNWFKCIGKYDDGTEFDFATYQQAQERLILKLIEIYKNGK